MDTIWPLLSSLDFLGWSVMFHPSPPWHTYAHVFPSHCNSYHSFCLDVCALTIPTWAMPLICDGYTSLFSLVFLKEIILYGLCYHSCPSFSSFAPLHSAPPLPQAIPTPLSVSMGRMCVSFGYSVPCVGLHIPWLFCNYHSVLPDLHLLCPSTHPLLSGCHRNVLCP